MSINKVILIGNVGKDPDVRYLDNGVVKCSFSLATSESYKNKAGEKVTNTEWHNIVIWRELAKAAEAYVKKGMQLYIEGKISTRSYQDKDGVQRRVTEITADTFQMLGRKQEGQQTTEHEEKPKSEPSASEEPSQDADDLPF
jgi:single-strand DNA-binding protein